MLAKHRHMFPPVASPGVNLAEGHADSQQFDNIFGAIRTGTAFQAGKMIHRIQLLYLCMNSGVSHSTPTNGDCCFVLTPPKMLE